MMKRNRVWAAVLSGVLLLGLCACGGKNQVEENLPDAVLSPDAYQVETVEASWDTGFLWFFCADQRFFYTAGVQELMDDASREVPLYAFDPETKETEEITLPLGDGWHLCTMTPAPDGGDRMAFTPLTFGGTTTNYTPNPCWLVNRPTSSFRSNSGLICPSTVRSRCALPMSSAQSPANMPGIRRILWDWLPAEEDGVLQARADLRRSGTGRCGGSQ